MKQIKYIFLCGSILVMTTACDLSRDPLSEFSEVTIGSENKNNDGIKYATRAEMKGQYDGLYNGIKGFKEAGYSDFLTNTDTHADNAYSGTTGAELASLEMQTQDGGNKNIERDWNGYLGQIGAANRIICNVDKVPDPALTENERKQWKAEACIWRAYVLFDMTRFWGAIPVVTQETPDITADNIDEIYPLLFPARESVEKVYAQIVEDLTYGATFAPDVNSSNKFLLSKSVAKALLAKVYAEKPIRDYEKTIEYCDKVIADGFSLVTNYDDLFAINEAKTDAKMRNSSESIFEITSYSGGWDGNWPSMFGLDHTDPSSTYDWAKWVTPSRDLIRAFKKDPKDVRFAASVKLDKAPWTNHYGRDEEFFYPFMYKQRSGFNSIIKIRLADILLLKAEALVEKDRLSEAAIIVDQIRNRAKASTLTDDIKASKIKMQNAVLNERRLELAFEGQRWFDLIRTDKVFEVMNSLNSRDEGRMHMATIVPRLLVFPIPQTQIDTNPSLIQNEGY